MNDIDIKFEIKNGRVFVTPFDVKLGSTKMNISGDQGIDQTLNYLIKTSIPSAEFGGAANALLTNLTKGLVQPGEFVNINLAVTGTFKKPEVRPVLAGGSSGEGGVKDQVKAAAEQKVEEVKQQVSQKAREQAEKLIRDAEAEAQKIRDAAKSAADLARKEGYAAADKAEAQASNPLQKAVAKKAAEKLRKEADSKANKIIEEGNAKADAVINKAKEEAAKIGQ